MANTTRRHFLGTMGAGMAAAATPQLLRAAGKRKPNIVFILSDDVGLDLMGCYGSDRFKTPNIDALARGEYASRPVTRRRCAVRRAVSSTPGATHSAPAD